MEKLFTDSEEWTSEAIEVSLEFSRAIEGIMRHYVDKGYLIRELSCIAHGCVTDTECKLILDKRMKDETRLIGEACEAANSKSG